MSKIDIFMESVNYVAQKIDFSILDSPKERRRFSSMLVDIFNYVYDSRGYIDYEHCKEDNGYVIVPAIITVKKSGVKYVGLVQLSLEDRGEHISTAIFSKDGLIEEDDMTIYEIIGEYNYRPIITVAKDHHVDYDKPIVY